MTRTAQRNTGLLTLIVAAAALALALVEMTSRIDGAVADDENSPRWATRRIADQSFAYRGAPVTLTPAHNADAAPIVSVRWGDAEAALPVTGREDPRLPQLLRHDDWLRVFEVRAVTDRPDPAASETAPDDHRKLVAVARAPAPGYDPETWGRVRQKDWTYTFLEFLPRGAIEQTAMPRSALPPGSWQEVAALQITPGVRRSAALKFTQSMMHPGKAPEEDSFSSLGWTWTVAGLSVMGLVVGAMLFGASFITGWRAPADH